MGLPPAQVIQAKDRLKVAPDRVYVIPPNKDLSILHGVLLLLEPAAPRSLRLPIDFFFRSLADDRRAGGTGSSCRGWALTARWAFGPSRRKPGWLPLTDADGRVTGLSIVVEEITEHKQAEAAMKRLASFPMLNPRPIVEVDVAGHVHFCNPVSEQMFPDLGQRGLGHPYLGDWESVLRTLRQSGAQSIVREVHFDEKWYHQTIHFVDDAQRVRIYGSDVTARKKIEEALQKAHDELEEQVEERTELESIIERAVILCPGPVLQLADKLDISSTPMSSAVRTLEEVERNQIHKILKETRWRIEGKEGAAAILGLQPSTLRARMHKLGILRPKAKASG